ncbi:uncharacterized protein LOC108039574 [Drosophila rhopaloa]|uniref:Uncharacterized protein LOC108039574 n=1 Tax=Drosophila rhopaloa TaxID=1041015 RepID=A0A6P4EFK0_DRORH|nr:uncharacterized protein LOC108039574 [Drosophila rhopaloa]
MGHEVFSTKSQLWLQGFPAPRDIPKIVISSCQSSSSLHSIRSASRHDIHSSHGTGSREIAASYETASTEGGILMDSPLQRSDAISEFERFAHNPTHILESSECSDVTSGVQIAPPQRSQTLDMLNSSDCSHSDSDSRIEKRIRHKSIKAQAKCSSTAFRTTENTLLSAANGFPPHYTAIFLGNRHHPNGSSESVNRQLSGQFLTGNSGRSADPSCYLQYHQYFPSRPVMGSLGLELAHQHQPHLMNQPPRRILDVAVPLPGNSPDVDNYMPSGDLRSEYGIRKCFSRPSLPFVISIFALGGVACTLGGIVLGSTGLIEHSTQYLSAALLMIGIGVSLLVISGAIWRLSLPDEVDNCLCFRQSETCRNCNSPHCQNRALSGSYLYPEFQNRQPPPSYLTSLNEYALFYYHSANSAATVVAHTPVGISTPPPLYCSTYSLNTSNTSGPPERYSYSRTIEFPSNNRAAALCTREDVGQTSSKDLNNAEVPAAEPLGRRILSPNTFKDAELD